MADIYVSPDDEARGYDSTPELGPMTGMASVLSRFQNELRRLTSGPAPNEKPRGMGSVRFTVHCPVGAEEVLRRARMILKILDEATLAGWPSQNHVVLRLPGWFTSACARPATTEEAEKWLAWWRKLPPHEQAKAETEKDWSLESWLYWMEPDNRQWFWWDARTVDGHITAAIEVDAWPFPWGALRWLFRAAGASAVKVEE